MGKMKFSSELMPASSEVSWNRFQIVDSESVSGIDSVIYGYGIGIGFGIGSGIGNSSEIDSNIGIGSGIDSKNGIG